MTTLTLDTNDSGIVIESLLATINKNEAYHQKRQASDSGDVVAASVLRRFLVDFHPELTKEFAEYVLKEAKEDNYDNTVAGCIKSLDYHRDTFDDKTVDSVLAELAAM